MKEKLLSVLLALVLEAAGAEILTKLCCHRIHDVGGERLPLSLQSHSIRQKRLSVLSILYRKSHTDNGSTILIPATFTTRMPSNEKERYTLATATTEITTAISRLRTTRRHFSKPSVISRDPSPLEPILTDGSEEGKSVSTTRLFPTDNTGLGPGDIPGAGGTNGVVDSGLPLAFRPPFPAPDDKVTLTFLPSYPNSPRISPDQVKEAPFYPLTRGPVYSRTPYVESPFFHSNGIPPGPKLNGGGSSLYHHMAQPPDLGRNLLPAVAGSVPIPPVHSQSGILPDRERASHFHPSPNTVPASPTLQARLQVNSEKRQPTLRREPRPPSPSVSPSPSPSPTTSQETARVSSPSAGTTTSTPISAANVVTGAPAQLSCSGKIGYFSDPTPAGCDAFLYCDQFGRSYRFLCPQGTHFNSRLCLCDLHSPCVDGKEKVSRLISPDDPCPPLLADGR